MLWLDGADMTCVCSNPVSGINCDRGVSGDRGVGVDIGATNSLGLKGVTAPLRSKAFHAFLSRGTAVNELQMNMQVNDSSLQWRRRYVLGGKSTEQSVGRSQITAQPVWINVQNG